MSVLVEKGARFGGVCVQKWRGWGWLDVREERDRHSPTVESSNLKELCCLKEP